MRLGRNGLCWGGQWPPDGQLEPTGARGDWARLGVNLDVSLRKIQSVINIIILVWLQSTLGLNLFPSVDMRCAVHTLKV